MQLQNLSFSVYMYKELQIMVRPFNVSLSYIKLLFLFLTSIIDTPSVAYRGRGAFVSSLELHRCYSLRLAA